MFAGHPLLMSLLAAWSLIGLSNELRAQTLVYLDLSGKVMELAAAGGEPRVLVDAAGTGPDGIAVDDRTGHLYWTTMGKVSLDDGSVMRADSDGKNVTVIVPAGGTFTPKQLEIDTRHRKLYWADREGMRIMRADLDGSNIETLIITGTGDTARKDQSLWCVGIALDVERGKLYWTQKGSDNAHQGTIKRANLEIRAGERPDRRSDIEVLFAGLPEPIDLDLDLQARQIYWSDRGDNTLSRAPMDPQTGFDPRSRGDREILVRGLREFIGVALDLRAGRMYYTSLAGELGTAGLDGKGARLLLGNQGRFTGIAVVNR